MHSHSGLIRCAVGAREWNMAAKEQEDHADGNT